MAHAKEATITISQADGLPSGDVNASVDLVYPGTLVDARVDATATSGTCAVMPRYLVMVWQTCTYVLPAVPGRRKVGLDLPGGWPRYPARVDGGSVA
jgi:hypothetical protein